MAFAPTRRDLARLLGAGLLLPRAGRAFAAPSAATDRKFIFLFCEGGYDPTWLFAPMQDAENVYTAADEGAETRSQDGLTWVHNDRRAQATTFLQAYADRTCFINGFEVRSVTHEACRRIIMTGGTATTTDDWPSTIAAAGAGYVLPSLVLSGPSYTFDNGNSVMRVGDDGQLAKLLSGQALSMSDLPVAPPGATADAAVEAFVQARTRAFAAAAGQGQPQRFGQAMQTSLDQLAVVRALPELDLAVEADGWVFVSDRVEAALTALEQGLTRCITVQHRGEFDIGWDTHADLLRQENNYNILFDDLVAILAALESRTGPSGTPLSQEVTVVVFSEMGRAPQLNSTGGKDHWTFTSAMLIGAGVAGGQVIGAYDEQLVGQPIDLSTGRVDTHGTTPTSQHFGATLLALAGLDPEALVGVPAISAALSG